METAGPGVEQLAKAADAKVASAGQVREEATVLAKDTARKLQRETNGHLRSQSKAQLLDLAASVEIKGRKNMSKAQLISAITTAAHTAR